ncbi:hypothetical protein OG552_21435 [Streptomyces sp. NBC_01476]|uniref:hypothetical protein n=1 Tax=Streptomyces sp. NBC_01476 TaxID=2903881 RepID=UPI002E2FA1C8|nr:hypothetical protein [Streptomyces sp. NBC_01476]
MHGEADYGFIISLDTQGSSGLSDPDRPAMRERYYQVAERAFAKAGLGGARLFQEDRGDGILAVVEARRTERVAGEWVEHLHQELRQVNRDLQRPLRLRAGLNIGPVTPDGHGFSGAAVDLACRIGNCAEAKSVLAAAPGSPLLVAVSDRLYQDVIRHGGRWIEPGRYRQYDVALQEGPQRPWFMVPGRTSPPAAARPGEPAAAPTPAPSPAPAPAPASSPAPGSAEPPAGARTFTFGAVTHSGSGDVYQGDIHEVTIDRRRGERS